jgi:hypothetical protein
MRRAMPDRQAYAQMSSPKRIWTVLVFLLLACASQFGWQVWVVVLVEVP